MISPKAVGLIIRHFDAIDQSVSKRLVRKRPWGEPALTSLLCDLLDQETQEEEKINYSLSELTKDLTEMDGLMSMSFTVDTHEYDSIMERWVTQADLGLIVKFTDELLPADSWSTAWLLQAKRLYPSSRNPVVYTEACRFGAVDHNQNERMRLLEKIVGIPFIRYLLYCPRPYSLDNTTAVKLTHLRNRNLGNRIFDYTLGLILHDELSLRNSSLSPGLFVSDSTDPPPNFGHVHSHILSDFFPFSWFLASHLVDEGPRFRHISRHSPGGGPGRPSKRSELEPDESASKWAEGIVGGNQEAIERLIEVFEGEIEGPFPILPSHTLKVNISIGSDLDLESRRIRHQ